MMGRSQTEPEKRRGFLLTEQGRHRFRQAFRDVDGRRRSFDSVEGLDHRTVSKVYNGREPVNLTNLEMCFDACGLEAKPKDYMEYLSPPSMPALLQVPVSPLKLVQIDSVPEPDGDLPFSPPRGPVPANSGLYITRPADTELSSALRRRDTTILIKGPHQTGRLRCWREGLPGRVMEGRAPAVPTSVACPAKISPRRTTSTVPCAVPWPSPA